MLRLTGHYSLVSLRRSCRYPRSIQSIHVLASICDHVRTLSTETNYRTGDKFRPHAQRGALSLSHLTSNSAAFENFCPQRVRSLCTRSQPTLENRSKINAIGLKALQWWDTQIVQSRYGRLMRLDKPVGTRLLFLPCAWSISMGASSVSDALSLFGLFYAGAVLLRGAGCTINDIWDADIDPLVQRTRSRPIAAGEVSIPAAFAFLTAQLCGGLVVLLSLNQTSFLVGAPSVIPVMFYPLAKRLSKYPQAVLGLTFNWGALLGYAAATGTLSETALFLYGAGWCWTMIYDTIYAHQDKKDDARIGVHSSALTLGNKTRLALGGFAVGKMALLTLAGMYGDLSMPYFIGISLTGAHTLRQVIRTNFDDPNECLRTFNSNVTTGAITWGAIIAGRMY